MSDLALLHAVIAYARANGWHHDITDLSGLPRDHRWQRDGAEVNWFNACLYVNNTKFRPASVRQAVNLLVDLDVLPVTFHSAYAAGQAVTEDTSCHHGPGEVCVFCIKNSDVATAAVNDLSDKYGVPRDLGRQIAADVPATEEPTRTLTAPERRAESEYIPPVGVREESEGSDHECGYYFREGLGYLPYDAECEACCELATARWKQAYNRAAACRYPNDPVTDTERVSDAIDAKAAEAGEL